MGIRVLRSVVLLTSFALLVLIGWVSRSTFLTRDEAAYSVRPPDLEECRVPEVPPDL